MRRDDYIKESESQSIKKNIELIVDLYRKYKSQFKRQSELVKFIADKVELPEMSVVQALEMNAESKEKTMSEFEKYVEMAGRQKEDKQAWWKKNFQRLIEFADDQNEYALDIIVQDIEDDEEREETRDAEADGTGKSIALGLLNALSIEELDDLLEDYELERVEDED